MPNDARSGALALRAMIFEVAADLGLNPPTETLKWGQPSYQTKGGSPLRIGIPKPKSGHGAFAIYTHCQTSLIHDFANLHGLDFIIEGNRAVHFQTEQDIQPEKLRQLIRHALTYQSG